jgi:hypothetical protein
MEGQGFWPIAHRIKERRALMNENGSDDVTEWRSSSLPPVEFKVTACRAMRGSGSTEIDMVEEVSLVSPVALESDDMATHECTTDDGMERRSSSLTPVEFKVTACRAMHGSGSTEIDMVEEAGCCHASVKTAPQKRGCQHLYQCTSTTSSLQILAAHKATVKHGPPRNVNGRRRDRRKNAKVNALRNVVTSTRHAIQMGDKKNSKPVFFSGTSRRMVPNKPLGSIVYSAILDMEVVDTVEGAQMKSDSGDTVFVLIPREQAIAKLSHVNKTLQSLHGLNDAKGFSKKRGKKRMTIPEGDNSNYATVGLKAYRGGTGILDSWPEKISENDKKQVIKFMNACQEVADGYLPSEDLRGIQIAKCILQWQEMEGCGQKWVWASFSEALNTFLSSHTDEDFFYSLLTLASAHALREEIDRYKLSADVSNYFVFAEQGIAVAMRPGDMLIFNPKYHHCLSSRASAYENEDVFSLSLYLKTAIVGKNDNSIPLNNTENKLLGKTINLY